MVVGVASGVISQRIGGAEAGFVAPTSCLDTTLKVTNNYCAASLCSGCERGPLQILRGMGDE